MRSKLPESRRGTVNPFKEEVCERLVEEVERGTLKQTKREMLFPSLVQSEDSGQCDS